MISTFLTLLGTLALGSASSTCSYLGQRPQTGFQSKFYFTGDFRMQQPGLDMCTTDSAAHFGQALTPDDLVMARDLQDSMCPSGFYPGEFRGTSIGAEIEAYPMHCSYKDCTEGTTGFERADAATCHVKPSACARGKSYYCNLAKPADGVNGTDANCASTEEITACAESCQPVCMNTTDTYSGGSCSKRLYVLKSKPTINTCAEACTNLTQCAAFRFVPYNTDLKQDTGRGQYCTLHSFQQGGVVSTASYSYTCLRMKHPNRPADFSGYSPMPLALGEALKQSQCGSSKV